MRDLGRRLAALELRHSTGRGEPDFNKLTSEDLAFFQDAIDRCGGLDDDGNWDTSALSAEDLRRLRAITEAATR